MEKLFETAFNALQRWPIVQGAVAILILAVAAVMVMKGLREKPATPPAPVPVQVESSWLVITLNAMSVEIQSISRRVDEIARAVADLVHRADKA